MSITTIKLDTLTKSALNSYKERKSETYDEVLRKILYIVKNVKEKPELSRDAIIDIEKAKERIKKGNFVSEKEAFMQLGFKV